MLGIGILASSFLFLGGYLSQKTQEIKEKKIVYINPWEKYSDPMRKYYLAFL